MLRCAAPRDNVVNVLSAVHTEEWCTVANHPALGLARCRQRSLEGTALRCTSPHGSSFGLWPAAQGGGHCAALHGAAAGLARRRQRSPEGTALRCMAHGQDRPVRPGEKAFPSPQSPGWETLRGGRALSLEPAGQGRGKAGGRQGKGARPGSAGATQTRVRGPAPFCLRA